MMWSYRAVNNKIARKKWIYLSLSLILSAIIVSFLRFSGGVDVKKIVLSLTIFIFVVMLYMLITLGKIRYYFIEEDTIYYKPLKTKLEEIKDFVVDKENMVIRLKFKKLKLLGVKTLYFEKLEDLEKAEKLLKDLIKSQV
ncbi:hypothetical protein DRO97_01545 [Archaeoglobales archaeon]|nr:MAG: hypothetical protein DRO97_01545 [Archaeoglobales archaeon]